MEDFNQLVRDEINNLNMIVFGKLTQKELIEKYKNENLSRQRMVNLLACYYNSNTAAFVEKHKNENSSGTRLNNLLPSYCHSNPIILINDTKRRDVDYAEVQSEINKYLRTFLPEDYAITFNNHKNLSKFVVELIPKHMNFTAGQ